MVTQTYNLFDSLPRSLRTDVRPRAARAAFKLLLVAIGLNIVAAARAEHCSMDWSRPACGKVCKLVSETKKITAIGYGNECKSICLPPPSEPGCKHCDCCC